jgi:phosphoribosyl 1,2-cyclic phosphodiesterase
MSGKEVERYGGHTACVEVSAPGAPSLVFDCGTGAQALGQQIIESGQTEITILFSHTHMDHLFALPFFAPALSPRCTVTLGVPATDAAEARDKIGEYLNGVFHPLRIADLPAKVVFQAVEPDQGFEVGPYKVSTLRLAHPGGTIGYRVSLGEQVVCYLTDTAPLAPPDQGLIVGEPPGQRESELMDLVRGADLMIMDTTFTQDEYLKKMSWGHGYPEYAVCLAKAAGVKRVALFHHSPDATDVDMDEIATRWQGHTAPLVSPAREGEVVDLSG